MDADEIARIFESELNQLDDDDGDEDDDIDLKLLEQLGLQLRSSLKASDPGEFDDDEWAELMQSSQNASDRLQVIESQVKNASPAKGVSGEGDGQIHIVRQMLHKLTSNDFNLLSDEDKTIVKDLMMSMIDSVEYSSSIQVPKSKMVMGKVEVDLSLLPRIISADDVHTLSEAVGATEEDHKKSGYGQRGDSSLNERFERARSLESLQLVREAEDKLRKEAEEAARTLEEDRQQRLQRKQRMIEEIVRAKRIKATVNKK